MLAPDGFQFPLESAQPQWRSAAKTETDASLQLLRRRIPLAAQAVHIAAQALGLGEGATEDDIAIAVSSGNPEILLKLKQAEIDYKVKMEELGVDLERVHATDRASAREMAAKAGITPQVVLATVYVVGFVWLLYALFSGQVNIDQSLREVGMILIGGLIAGNEQIRNFFFGSSSGSVRKSATIEKLTKET